MKCEKSPTELNCVNDVARRDNLAGFKVGTLPTLIDGKQARELMRRALFEQWLIDHP